MNKYAKGDNSQSKGSDLYRKGAAGSKSNYKSLLLLLRPRQWTKNLVLFAALIFSYSVFDLQLLYSSILAFCSFCLLSSSAYILNDIYDINEDRAHPRKKFRPLAAKHISVKEALILFIPLFIAALTLAWIINFYFALSAVAYFLVAISYTIWFKHIVILDLFAIAAGFLIRALAGALAIEVIVSPWFLFCSLLLSLFLALTKRRQELVKLGSNRGSYRKLLDHYPLPYLDQLISIVTASTIISYSLYTFTAGPTMLLMLTIPFVAYGIFRYLYLVYKIEIEDNPDELLLKDIPLVITIVSWALLSLIILAIENGAFLR